MSCWSCPSKDQSRCTFTISNRYQTTAISTGHKDSRAPAANGKLLFAEHQYRYSERYHETQSVFSSTPIKMAVLPMGVEPSVDAGLGSARQRQSSNDGCLVRSTKAQNRLGLADFFHHLSQPHHDRHSFGGELWALNSLGHLIHSSKLTIKQL